jgi:hypothetical protein
MNAASIKERLAALQATQDARKPKTWGVVRVDSGTVEFTTGRKMRSLTDLKERIWNMTLGTAKAGMENGAGYVGTPWGDGDVTIGTCERFEMRHLPRRPKMASLGSLVLESRTSGIRLGDCGRADVVVTFPEPVSVIQFIWQGKTLWLIY